MHSATNVRTVPIDLDASDLAVLEVLEHLGRGTVGEHIARAVSRYVEQHTPTLSDLEQLPFHRQRAPRPIERKPA